MEYRMFARRVLDRPLRVAILDHRGLRFVAKVLNTSEGGLGLLCDQAFEIGSVLQVITGSLWCDTKVRHCTRTGNEYTVGVEYTDAHKGKAITNSLNRGHL